MTGLLVLALLAATGRPVAGDLSVCDFDRTDRLWTPDGASPTVAKVRTPLAHSGKACLEVKVTRQGNLLRATWGCDVPDLLLAQGSRFRFWVRGSNLCRPGPGQPHGGLILVEAGGAKDGGDSHWLLEIPAGVYARPGWTEVTTAPIDTARNAEWAPDADGKIDAGRVRRLLFVSQQEDPGQALPGYTIYMDDLSASAATVRPMLETPAVNHSTPRAVRAVQRGFVGRRRDAGQQVLMGDVTGWKVRYYAGAEATLVRSGEEPLFGQPVAKLAYRSTGGPGLFRLEPPKPIVLQRFNGVLAWVFGNCWEWTPDPETPFVTVSLVLEDAGGEVHTVRMDPVAWKFWSVMHKCVKERVADDERHSAAGGDGNQRLDFPAKLLAVEISGGSNRAFRGIYLDSLIFRNEKPRPPVYDSATLAKLNHQPFPTTPDTFLPSLMVPVTNAVERRGAAYLFRSMGGTETIEYSYTPKTGTLTDLTVNAGGVPFTPCREGGPRLAEGSTPRAGLVGCQLRANKLHTVWRTDRGVQYGLSLCIKGKTMVCEWSSLSTAFVEVYPGRAEGLDAYKQVNVPYLTLGWGLPSVIWNRGRYLFSMFDIYNSNGSAICGESGRISDTSATCVGPSRYETLTDGTRNRMRERQFITVSSRFEEVLPSIPNPPSPLAAITGTNLYCHVGAIEPSRFKTSLERWRLFKEYGIDHVRVSHHEDAFSDGDTVGQGPQEFTMTLEAAPEVGDAQLIDYCRETRKLGYLVGLYTNYTDYPPIGAVWDERNVVKHPNGEWQRAWPPDFALKPLKAIEMEARYAPRIARKFGTNTVYCDVHTCLPPMGMVDYEAGNPGAGMERTQVKAYGALLLDGRKSYGGPVFSEGTHHWIYAGLDDGNYAQMGLPDAPNQPLLLDFDLRKIHPLQANLSMTPAWRWGEGLRQCMATQIAYGHIGFLPFDNLQDACWGYYMMQQLQSRYTQQPVASILYTAADGTAHDVSAAIPLGAHANNQVQVTYRNGLSLYANCNKARAWSVQVDGKGYTLPPFGWIAWDRGFREYSAEFDGRRVDFVDSPVYTYLSTGAKPFRDGGIETTGTVILRKDEALGPRVIPVTGSSVTVDGPWRSATACRGDGTPIGPATVERTATGLTVRYLDGARSYILGR